jgi:hypothetical protein
MNKFYSKLSWWWPLLSTTMVELMTKRKWSIFIGLIGFWQTRNELLIERNQGILQTKPIYVEFKMPPALQGLYLLESVLCCEIRTKKKILALWEAPKQNMSEIQIWTFWKKSFLNLSVRLKIIFFVVLSNIPQIYSKRANVIP